MEFLYAIFVQKGGHQGEKEYSLFPAGGTITLSVYQKSNHRGITVRFNFQRIDDISIKDK